ncbi:hypothetical protein MmiHf6_06030 [Methanimicrococcus hongohii]|uniref:Uncharacterized protein n=1 Tax=Methanimicrococcus hongohii TaxID=3028295 RepID=A0AA96V1H6_9EURY|nr:hypothetical protein MmiHf6_06030 [Methanimicrococcus sp. Hf6]
MKIKNIFLLPLPVYLLLPLPVCSLLPLPVCLLLLLPVCLLLLLPVCLLLLLPVFLLLLLSICFLPSPMFTFTRIARRARTAQFFKSFSILLPSFLFKFSICPFFSELNCLRIVFNNWAIIYQAYCTLLALR